MGGRRVRKWTEAEDATRELDGKLRAGLRRTGGNECRKRCDHELEIGMDRSQNLLDLGDWQSAVRRGDQVSARQKERVSHSDVDCLGTAVYLSAGTKPTCAER
jgi:hypothetical protein